MLDQATDRFQRQSGGDGPPLISFIVPRMSRPVMSAIYVETSIVGYLTARSASDVVFQARQELTWNCKHIANADLLPALYETLRAEGFPPPLIVTPEEFSDAG